MNSLPLYIESLLCYTRGIFEEAIGTEIAVEIAVEDLGEIYHVCMHLPFQKSEY